MATSGPRRSRHRTTAQPADEVETFLTSVAPDQRRLLMAARALIKNLVPSAVERVRVGWGLLGFSAPRYFAFVVASEGNFTPRNALARFIVWPRAKPMIRRLTGRVLVELETFLTAQERSAVTSAGGPGGRP